MSLLTLPRLGRIEEGLASLNGLDRMGQPADFRLRNRAPQPCFACQFHELRREIQSEEQDRDVCARFGDSEFRPSKVRSPCRTGRLSSAIMIRTIGGPLSAAQQRSLRDL